MTVDELRELLAEVDGHLEVRLPIERDGVFGEEDIGQVVQRESMFGEGKIVAIVSENDV